MQSTFVQKVLPVKCTKLLSTKWATKSAAPSASGHWEWPRLQLLRQSQFTNRATSSHWSRQCKVKKSTKIINSATSTGAISMTETHTVPKSTRDHQQSNSATGLVSSSHQSYFYRKHHSAERWDLEFGSNTTEKFENSLKYLKTHWKIWKLTRRSREEMLNYSSWLIILRNNK